MNFLFGNPQNDAIAKATSKHLLAPDTKANQLICNDINNPTPDSNSDIRYADKLRNYYKSLLKHLKSLNDKPMQCLLTLHIVEMIAQRCAVFINYLSEKDFIAQLIDIATETGNGMNGEVSISHRRSSSKQKYHTGEQLAVIQQCRQKALQLIYEWNLVYGRTGHNTYPVFTDVYTRLQDRGCVFPTTSVMDIKPNYTAARSTRLSVDTFGNVVDEAGNIVVSGKRRGSSYNNSAVAGTRYAMSNSASVTRPPSYSSRQQSMPRQRSTPRPPRPYVQQYASVTPEYTKKVQEECASVLNYLQLLRDMLVLAQSDGSDDIRKNDSIQSLVAVVREIKTRMSRIIAEVDGEYLLNLTIEYHTFIYNVLEFYEQCCKKTAGEPPVLPDQFIDNSTALVEAVQQRTDEVLDLSVFNDALPSSSSTSLVPTPKPAENTQPELYDYAHALNVTGTKNQQVLPTGGYEATPFDDVDDSAHTGAESNATSAAATPVKQKKKKSRSKQSKHSSTKHVEEVKTDDPFAEPNVFEA